MTMACRCGLALGAALLLLGALVSSQAVARASASTTTRGRTRTSPARSHPWSARWGVPALVPCSGGSWRAATTTRRRSSAARCWAGSALGTNAFNEHKEQQATTQYDQQQQLAYTQSQLAQQEAVNRQLEAQSLYGEWGQQHGLAAPSGPGEVTTAQRMLTVLGYYSGPIDGVNGPATSTAIAEFQKGRGQPITGNVTPALLQQLRVATPGVWPSRWP